MPFSFPGFDALLEATVLPALVLSADAAVMSVNRSGAALVELHPAMRMEGGRLALRREEEQSALSDALHRILVERDADRIVVLLRSRRGRPTLLLRLAAIRTEAASAVLLELSALEVELDDAINLANIFGLTRTQAAVTSWLARGLSVPEIAVEMGVKESTLRTHIREACERLDLSGQLQLALWVSHVARLTGLFAHRPQE